MTTNDKYKTLLRNLNSIKSNTDSDLLRVAIDLQKNAEQFADYLIKDFMITIDATRFNPVRFDTKIKAVQSIALSRKEVSTLHRIKRIGNQAERGEESSKLTQENLLSAIHNYSKILNDFSHNADKKIEQYKKSII